MNSHPLFDHSMSVGMITGDAPRYASAPGGHEALKQDLSAQGAQFEETEGNYGGPERSLLVYGLPRHHLTALGKKYGQEAVIHCEGGQRHLIYTNGPNEGRWHPGHPTHEHWPEGETPPGDNWTKLPGGGTVRLHFDFDQLHPQQQSGPTSVPQNVAAGPVTKHEVGHALYQMLKKADFLHTATTAPLSPSHNVLADAAAYHEDAGLPPPPTTPHVTDEGLLQRAAAHYEGAQHEPHNPEVRAAYDALKRETLAQYNHLLARGYRFTPVSGNVTPASFDHSQVQGFDKDQGFAYSGGDEVAPPYAGSYKALFDDIHNNKHLHVFTGGDIPHDHPLAEPVPGGGPLPTYNDVFRAVHDVFGHAKAGADFGHHGEDHTWAAHAPMFSPLARRALTTETRGQNSAFHYGANGAHNRANPAAAVYPAQKATLMPPEFHGAPAAPAPAPTAPITKHEVSYRLYQMLKKADLPVEWAPERNLQVTGPQAVPSQFEENAVSDEKKLTIAETLHGLYTGLKQRVTKFESTCLDLRKAEQAALAKSLKKGALGDGGFADPSTEKGHANKPFTKGESCKACGETGCDCDAAEKFAKGEGNPAAYGPGGSAMAPPMAKAELCKACGMSKAEHDCDKAEAFAKGEIKATFTSREEGRKQYEALQNKKKGGSRSCSKCGKGFEPDGDGKLCSPCGATSKAEVQPAGAAPDGPQPTPGKTPDDKKSKKQGPTEGNGELAKAGEGGVPAAPSAPKAAGPATPKSPSMPKLPGPKAAGAAKPPAMGAGTPAPAAKAEKKPEAKKPYDHDADLANYDRHKDPKYVKPWGVSADLEPKKSSSPIRKDLTWSPSSKQSGPTPSPFGATPPPPPPGVAKPMKKAGVTLPGHKAAAAKQTPIGHGLAAAKDQHFGAGTNMQREALPSPTDLASAQKQQPAQAYKLPGVRASVGATMDSMLGKPAAQPVAPVKPTDHLVGSGMPVKGPLVGAGTPKPAQGVQTMAERVASKVPVKPAPSGFSAPPPEARPGAAPAPTATAPKPTQPKKP